MRCKDEKVKNETEHLKFLEQYQLIYYKYKWSNRRKGVRKWNRTNICSHSGNFFPNTIFKNASIYGSKRFSEPQVEYKTHACAHAHTHMHTFTYTQHSQIAKK